MFSYSVLLCVDFEPRYLADSSINELILGNDEIFHTKESNHGGLTRGAIDSYMVSKLSTWNSSLAWTDINAVTNIYSRPNTNYADLKRIIISSGDEGSRVTLRLDLSNGPSVLWLCELNLGVSYSEEYGRLHTDADIYVLYDAGAISAKAFAEKSNDQRKNKLVKYQQ